MADTDESGRAKPVVIIPPLSNDNGDMSVQVFEHTDESKYEAARAVMDMCVGGHPGEPEYERDLAYLVSAARAVFWRQHHDDPNEDDGCMCEDAGWWCDQLDEGPQEPFWFFDCADIGAPPDLPLSGASHKVEQPRAATVDIDPQDAAASLGELSLPAKDGAGLPLSGASAGAVELGDKS